MSRSETIDWLIWHAAAQREAIDRAIRSLYADLDAAVTERSPVCNTSGRCCRFEEYGHRLYVTGLEIAWFTQAAGNRELGVGGTVKTESGPGISLQQLASVSSHQPAAPPGACPYQVGGLCSTHAIRPLGCRVFFCEVGTEDWQQDTTELFLDRLKQLHTEQDLPYAYMEWRAGLAAARRVFDGSI